MIKDLKLIDTKNNDWEDLTSDEQGNIHIGDFGDNNKKKNTILKVNNPKMQIPVLIQKIQISPCPKVKNSKILKLFSY